MTSLVSSVIDICSGLYEKAHLIRSQYFSAFRHPNSKTEDVLYSATGPTDSNCFTTRKVEAVRLPVRVRSYTDFICNVR